MSDHQPPEHFISERIVPEVEVDDGSIMKLYFQRQPGAGRSPKARWWLYSVRSTG